MSFGELPVPEFDYPIYRGTVYNTSCTCKHTRYGRGRFDLYGRRWLFVCMQCGSIRHPDQTLLGFVADTARRPVR